MKGRSAVTMVSVLMVVVRLDVPGSTRDLLAAVNTEYPWTNRASLD
jgi:hypothetical protein